MRQIVTLLLSLGSAVAAGVVGDFAFKRTRGVNQSDVGVVIWSHGGMATICAGLAFMFTAGLLLWAIRRVTRCEARWPSMIGVVASMLVLAALLAAWMM